VLSRADRHARFGSNSAIELREAASLNDVSVHAMGPGWRVEHWAADLLLRCKAGQQYGSADEQAVLPIIVRRSGPIGAAIAINIELPAE